MSPWRTEGFGPLLRQLRDHLRRFHPAWIHLWAVLIRQDVETQTCQNKMTDFRKKQEAAAAEVPSSSAASTQPQPGLKVSTTPPNAQQVCLKLSPAPWPEQLGLADMRLTRGGRLVLLAALGWQL